MYEVTHPGIDFCSTARFIILLPFGNLLLFNLQLISRILFGKFFIGIPECF